MAPRYSSTLRILIPFAGILTVALLFARPAYAVEFVDDGTIRAGEVIDDDVFITGERVRVDGTINGDLFATGAEVEINGEVAGSVFAAGQTITIDGSVAGSIYAAAAAMQLGGDATVGRNVLFAGFSVEAEDGSSVGRDIVFAGYQALIGGEVERDVRVGSGALEISGRIGGDVKADIGGPGEGGPQGFPPFFMPPGASSPVDSGLRVDRGAEIGGQLEYTSPVDQSSEFRAQPAGGVVYRTPPPGEGAPRLEDRSPALRFLSWFLARLRDFITLLILGGLAIWQLPGLLNQSVQKVSAAALPAAGWGLLSVVIGYAGAGLLAVLFVGIGIVLAVITLGNLAGTWFGLSLSGLALVFTIFGLLVAFGSKLVVAYWGGDWLVQRLAPDAQSTRIWALVAGVTIYVLLRGIPLLGWILGVLATLIGLGAIWLVYRDGRAAPEPAAA